MTTLPELYIETMWDDLSSLAVWHPDTRLEVGDIVEPGPNGLVVSATKLSSLDSSIPSMTTTTATAARVVNQNGVTFSASASATAQGAGTAEAKFARESSFLFVTGDGEVERVAEIEDARHVVLALHTAGKWKPEWSLVTAVRRYTACTVLIAKTAGVSVNLQLDGAAAGLSPDSVKAGVAVQADSSVMSTFALPATSTPLFEAVYLRETWLRKKQSVPVVAKVKRDSERPSVDDTAMQKHAVVQEATPHVLGLLRRSDAPPSELAH